MSCSCGSSGAVGRVHLSTPWDDHGITDIDLGVAEAAQVLSFSFRKATVRDQASLAAATYAKPHQYPSGDRTAVIVNGVQVVENAEHTGATPGKVLRRDAQGRVS